MENTIFTLQEFMTHTKAITYLIIGGILIFMPLFWKFLTGREND
ncbi:sulfate respiration complex protein HmcD [Desulfobacula sp.]